jgi:hypothetical protein
VTPGYDFWTAGFSICVLRHALPKPQFSAAFSGGPTGEGVVDGGEGAALK